MAKIKTPSPASQLSGLTDVQRAVIEGYALLHPERPARTKMLGWLNRVRKAEGKTGFNSEQLRDAIEELIGIGLLLASTSGAGVVSQGPTVITGLITPGCLAALAVDRAYPMLEFAIDEYEYMFTRYGTRQLPAAPGQLQLLLHDNVYEFRLLEQYARLEVLSGQFDASLEARLPENIWSWMVEPTAHPYLIKLPDLLRQKICLSGLYRLCLELLPARNFRELCLQHAPEPVQLLGISATTLILEGEFEQARTLLDSYVDETSAPGLTKILQVAKLSNEALIGALRGDAGEAVKKIEACIEAERAGTRKRNVFPVQPAFEIAILGLILDNSPQATQLFKSLTKSYTKLRLSSGMEDVYALVSHATEDQYVSTPRYRPSTYGLIDLLLALSTRWHAKFNLQSNHHDTFVYSLQLLLQQACTGGYQWVVAELLQVLEASNVRDSLLLPQTKELMVAHNAADLHGQMGTTSLASLIKPLEAWEKTLRSLELLAPADNKAKPQSDRKKTASKKRLVWQLLETDSYTIEAVPLEQTRGKSGWSSGRRISLQRLKNKPDEVTGLSAADLKVAATIRKISAYGWGGSTRYETDSRTVFQLIGHTAVIDENGEAIDVIERPAELRVTEQGNKVSLQIHPKPSGQHYVACFEEGTNRVYATHFTAAQRRLFDVIPLPGMEIPLSAKDRLLQIVASLSADIQVQSDAATVGSASIEGNTTPLLQLEIVDGGVQVRFKVEPLADTATLYDSGIGGAVVYVRKDGNSVAVSRNLQLERQAVRDLLDHLPQLAMWFDGQHGASIDNIPDALEMLEAVQQRKVRCVWVNDKRLSITANAGSNQLRLKIKSAEEWFSASGELKVNEDSINLSRLVSLVKNQSGSRFVEVGSGEFVSLSLKLRSQLQVLAAFSKRSAKKTTKKSADVESEMADGNDLTLEKLHPLAALVLGQQAQYDDESHQSVPFIEGDKRWSVQVKRVRQALAKPPKLPGTIQADLREYQLEGYQWLSQLGMAGAGACLADDMGLGKTLQSLSVLVNRAAGGPALVIAPTSVAGNWAEEAHRFAPTLNVSVYAENAGTRKSRQKSLETLEPFSVVIASYGLLVSDAEMFAALHWHTVVLDEAQAIKNAATKRAKAACRLQADMRIATTGTPIQNNLMDLHSLFEFLNPGLLGTRNDFHQRFAMPIERDRDEAVRQELQLLTAPFILRRLKRDVLKDLPSRTEINLSVELSEEEAALYETLRLDALESLKADSATAAAANNAPAVADVGFEENEDSQSQAHTQRFAILAQLMRLRRLCCNPRLIESDWTGPQSKLDLFRVTLQELLANRHKVLVFSQFVDHLKLIETELQKNKISYQYLDGSTPAKQRQKKVAAFQSGEGEVFLVSLTAGGTGLNLTAADYVIHLDPWWNPAVEDQASDRAHRIGQKRPVTIYRMVTKGTIEAQIQELHGNKRELAQSILSGTDKARVDPERLLDLLAQPYLS